MLFDIYCDESRQDLLVNKNAITDNNRFCCIGGIMIPQSKRTEIKNNIKQLKEKYRVFAELKWGTVSNNKIDFYLELIDYFFSDADLTFRTVVIDSLKIDNNFFNNDDHELGYYKFYYQLLLHWIEEDFSYYVFTDQKTNKDKTRLNELQRIINLTTHASSNVTHIQPICSRESLLLQLENIIMGAVGYKFNWRDQGLSSAKQDVVRRIEQHLGHAIVPTGRNSLKFNVFAIELRGGVR